MADEKVKAYIQACIDGANKEGISRAHSVRKWALLKEDFSIFGGELTPTMKLKRKVVEKKYAAEIEALYLDAKI
jgi:long-subunit acyl-CoA synthetase (AMP-forming)